MAGGVIAASASTPTVTGGYTYSLAADFSGATNVPTLVDVTALPATTAWIPGPSTGVIYNDGAGKLDGVVAMVVTNTATGLKVGKLVVDVSGSVSSVGKSNAPAVKMSLKGEGYSESGSTQSPLTFSAAFAGVLKTISNAPAGPFADSHVLVIETDPASGVTNSAYATSLSTATDFQSSYQEIGIVYHYFEVQSNYNDVSGPGGSGIATTNLTMVNDVIDTYTVNVGPVIASYTNYLTNVYVPAGSFSNKLVFTNGGQYVIATNSSGGSWTGITPAEVPDYLAAFAFNVTNGTPTNGGVVRQVIAALYTNTITGYTNPATGLANVFDEIVGTLKGSAKVGSASVPINDTASTLVADHTSWTDAKATLTSNNVFNLLAVGAFGGYTTNAFGINQHTNLVGYHIVYRENITGGLSETYKDTLNAKVVQYGAKFRTSAKTGSDSSDDFSGTGTIAVKTTTSHTNHFTATNYTAKLTGVAYARGSALALSGTNGYFVSYDTPNTVGSGVVLTLTNFASTNLLAYLLLM